MTTPRIDIDLKKISHNAQKLKALYASKGIGLMGVTKSVCGNPAVADVLVKSGIDTLADSRIQNIVKMRKAGVQARFVLIRAPAPSQVKSTVEHADMSLNTEMAVIEQLSAIALKSKKIHRIILMVEMGDLREGMMPVDLEQTVESVNKQKGVLLSGIGTNLACFGGVRPAKENIERLSMLAVDIEKKFGIKLEYVSGGNSANYDWFQSTEDVGSINNLRLGESIFLGCETLHRIPISGLFTDAFTLVTEVIESKEKPSKPYGDISQDAFGNVPEFPERGNMTRAILGIGLQDVNVAGLVPTMDIEVLGASSDHIILNAKNVDLKVGDEVEFNLNYRALLSAMTSPYVQKKFRN